MSFLAPTMLFGALAASVPIILHFFFRSRYRTVPWAAMRFLLLSIEQTSRRLKFQEWLLLLLRVAVLLLLAFALARPTWDSQGSSGKGDSVDAVLVFDTSGSMMAQDGEKTRWERAREAALGVIDQLPPYSTVQIITCSDRAKFLGPRVISNMEQARQIVRTLKPTHHSTDFHDGAREVLEALKRGQSPNREVYLFSDMQEQGWDQQQTSLTARMRAIKDQAALYLVRCGTRTPRNVAVVGIRPHLEELPLAGKETSFTVMVRNNGKEPVGDLTVSLAVNGEEAKGDATATKQQVIAPGETQSFQVSAVLGKAGPTRLSARVRPDDLDADNTYDRVIHVYDEPPILLIDGAPNPREAPKAADYFLAYALRPFPVEIITPSRASSAYLAKKEVCVLVNVQVGEQGTLPEQFLNGLEEFVHRGGHLIIFSGHQIDPQAYNILLYEKRPLLPVMLAEVQKAAMSKPWHLNRGSAEFPLARFRDDSDYKSMESVEIYQRVAVEKPGVGVRVLLSYDDGQPAIVSRQREAEGQVWMFTTSANDLEWTNWHLLAPAYLPVIQETSRYLANLHLSRHNRKVGEPLDWYPRSVSEAELPHVYVPPDAEAGEKPIRLGRPRTTGTKPVVTVTETSRAGIYTILCDASQVSAEPVKPAESAHFAVIPDFQETEDLTTLTPEEIDGQLGFEAIHVLAEQDASSWVGAERYKREWTLWLLVGLLVLVVGETVLAWFCGRAW